MLHEFSVQNYRAFATKQTIKVKPLTLFFGWNSGGKSALLRFLPLISESLAQRARPIWLGGEVSRRATWPSLVCRTTESAELIFSFGWKDPDCRAEWTVAGDLNGAWQEVRTFSFNDQVLELSPTDFDGIFPPVGIAVSGSFSLRSKLQNLSTEIQWLQGLRKKPERFVQFGGGAANKLKSDGSDVADHLIEALTTKNTAVLEEVKSFFSALKEDFSLDNPLDGVWRLLLCPTNSPKTRIDICDTGEGYSQVLPVLVALAKSMHDGPKLLCLEQPELHLHTRAQAQLAKQLVRAACASTQPSILVETHSEVLLSSIQLAIIEGDISPDMVQVYWVESRDDGTGAAMPITLDQNGSPDSSILAGAFGEALLIGQRLIEAQLKKQGMFLTEVSVETPRS